MKSFSSLIGCVPFDMDWINKECIQLEYENIKYAIGDIVKDQSLRCIKNMNLHISEEYWKILLLGICEKEKIQGEIDLFVGFPEKTFHQNKEICHEIENKIITFKTPEGFKNVKINKINITREIFGHLHGVNSLLDIGDRNLMLASIGFGNIEYCCLSSEKKPMYAYLSSNPSGIKTLCEIFKYKLIRNGFKFNANTESIYFYDDLIKSIYYNNIKNFDYNKENLHLFLKDSINEYIRIAIESDMKRFIFDNYFYDGVFAITGGGSLYKEISKSCYNIANKHGIDIEILKGNDCLLTACKGYEKISCNIKEKRPLLCIDFGNSNTVYSFLK